MEGEITIKVSYLDIKQQLLSILCDDNIVNPTNIVFKNEPDEGFDFSIDKLKHIYVAQWYKSASDYNNNKYGYCPMLRQELACNNSRFGLLLWGNHFCCFGFEFGHTEIL